MASMSEPIVAQAVWEWLARLHLMAAGSSSSVEAQTRIALVAPMIATRFPAEAFNRASVEHVGAGCKFWPAYGELVALLGEWWRENRGNRSLLIPYAGPSHIPESRAPPDEDERAAVRATVGGYIAERAALAVEQAQPRPPMPDVTLKGEALARSRAARGCNVPAREDAAPEEAAPDEWQPAPLRESQETAE